MTVAESEWDDQQRGWMLALAEWHDRRCRGCGGDLAETTDPGNSGDTMFDSRYQALPPMRCHRCTALAASEDAAKDNRHPHALIHRVQLVPAPRQHPADRQ